METVDFDPYQNEEMAAYFAEISAFAQDEHAVRVELLGENRIKLLSLRHICHMLLRLDFQILLIFIGWQMRLL